MSNSKRNIFQLNRKMSFTLTPSKGCHQAIRNDSTQMLSLLSTNYQIDHLPEYGCIHQYHFRGQPYQCNKMEMKQIQLKNKQKQRENAYINQIVNKKILVSENDKPKNLNYDNQENNKNNKNLQNNMLKNNKGSKRENNQNNEKLVKSQRANQKSLNKKVKKNNMNAQTKRKSELAISYTPQQVLKRIDPQLADNLVKQFMRTQKPFTRQLSNTAFAKIYQKTPLTVYGYKNRSVGSLLTNNYMKSFNVKPHSRQNNPQTYQSYNTALRFAKRTKLSDEKQFQKLQLQMAKLLKYKQNFQKIKRSKSENNLNKTLDQKYSYQNQIDQISSIKKNKQSKSLQKKKMNMSSNYNNELNDKIYQNQEQDFQNKFLEQINKIQKYYMTRNPILPEPVKNQEKRILDQIRRQNYKETKQNGLSSHYLVPCVINSYDKSKYSFRRSRVSSETQKY